MNTLTYFFINKKRTILTVLLSIAHMFLAVLFAILRVKFLAIYNILSAAFYLLMLLYTMQIKEFQFLVMVAFEIPLYSFIVSIFMGSFSGALLYPISMISGVFLFSVNSQYTLKRYLFISIPSVVAILLITFWPFSQILDPVHYKNLIITNRIFSSILAIVSLLYLNISAHEDLVVSRKKNELYIEQLKFMSNNDFLTKTLNRRSTQKRMADIPVYSLVMFDIDDFKKINDTYGHEAGDEILIELTSRIKKVIPETAMFSRWGGEEFLIIFPDHDENAILTFSNLCKTVSEEKYKLSHSPSINVTITGGVGFSQPGKTFENIVSQADKLLYTGKSNGKNQVVFPESY